MELFYYNIIFIIITTFCFYKSFTSITNYTSCTISDYVISIIYAFNCFPILLDVLIGVPKYFSWFSNFQIAADHKETGIIYNMYIILVMLVLFRYKVKKDHFLDSYNSKLIVEFGHNSKKNSKLITFIFIVFPFVYVFLEHGFDVFNSYSSLAARGIEDGTFINFLIMISSYLSVTSYYIQRKRSWWTFLLLIFYMFAIVFLNGKRYIIVTLLLMMLFYFEQFSHIIKRKINLKIVYGLLLTFILSFSVFYFAVVRPEHAANDNMYAMLRIDFGREDVTKFVIHREFIQEEPILDYAGQTYLSTIFAWIPRSIWTDKPYPHYRYLTGALTNQDVLDIRAGMTPSIFEMSIANFGWGGIIVTMLLLLWLCKLADNSRNLKIKLLYILIIVNLLTQAIDASLAFILLIVLYSLKPLFKIGKNSF